jgi:hypothetical protein
MAILDLFRRKGFLTGTVIVRGLPPHKAYSVSITTFRVPSASSPPPYGGDPPVDRYTNDEPVKEADEAEDKPLSFRLSRAEGSYFLGVGVIAYLDRDGKMFAQVERFLPMTRPCQVMSGCEHQVEVVVAWPAIPFEDLHAYGTIHPRKKGHRDA